MALINFTPSQGGKQGQNWNNLTNTRPALTRVMCQFSYKVSFLMWLKGVTILTTDESNGNMSLTALAASLEIKKPCKGCFFHFQTENGQIAATRSPWAVRMLPSVTTPATHPGTTVVTCSSHQVQRDPPVLHKVRNGGEKQGFNLKNTHSKARSASLQGAPSINALALPGTAQAVLVKSCLADPSFPRKNKLLKSFEKLICI